MTPEAALRAASLWVLQVVQRLAVERLNSVEYFQSRQDSHTFTNDVRGVATPLTESL